MALESAAAEAKRLAERARACRSAAIVFSDDAEGVASAAVASSMLDDLGKEYRMICLDKPVPDAIEALQDEAPSDLYILLGFHEDLSSSLPPELRASALLVAGSRHPGRPASAAAIVYLAHRRVRGSRVPTCGIALIGLEDPINAIGLDWLVLCDAVAEGLADKRGRRGGLRVRVGGAFRDAKAVRGEVWLASAAMYYRGGPLEAASALARGSYEEVRRLAREALGLVSSAFRGGIKNLELEGLFRLKAVQWFMGTGEFRGIGTSVFDDFVHRLRVKSRLVDRDKYILGIVERRPEVPGLPSLRRRWLSVSVSVPRYLEALISGGTAKPVSMLVGEAARYVDGIGYGTAHRGFAVIPAGVEDLFVSRFEELAGVRGGEAAPV